MNVKHVLDSLNLDQIHQELEQHSPVKDQVDTKSNHSQCSKAQLAKQFLNIISDRRLALRLRRDNRVAMACGFRRHTPSHGLSNHFRLGEETYIVLGWEGLGFYRLLERRLGIVPFDLFLGRFRLVEESIV